MRVAVNAKLLSEPSLRGWNRYTINLLAELPGAGAELYLYLERPMHEAHRARLPAGSFVERVAPPMRGLAWEQRWLPHQCALDRADVLHSPFNFGLPWSSRCPRVLTLHDAIEEVYYARSASWRLRLSPAHLRSRLSPWISRTRAHRFITVSEHSKADLVRYLGLPADRIAVTYEAADPRFREPVAPSDRERVRRRHGLDRPYVFYVGGWEGRKNVPFLVRAFAGAGLEGVDLVLAGGRDDQKRELQALADSLGAGGRLRLLGWIEDDELPALYAEALGFAYPSEYEGFGLQLCEAMAVGCPTLAARATCLPEVLGDGGETFSLGSPDELAALLRRVAGEAGFRAELSRRASARITDFSWRRTAEQTMTVYRQAREGR